MTFPLPSTATPVGELKLKPAAKGIYRGVAARRQNLIYLTGAIIGDEDVPSPVYRYVRDIAEAEAAGQRHHTDGAPTSRRNLLHHSGICDEDIPAAVYRYALGLAEAAAQRSLRARAEDQLRA